MDWLRERDRALERLTRGMRRTPIKDAISRSVVLAFGEGRIRRVAAYQRDLAGLASSNSIRAEIAEMEGYGTIIVVPDPTHRGAHLVWPTESTIAFFNEAAPMLRDKARELLGCNCVKKSDE